MSRYAIDEAIRYKVLSIPGVSALIEERMYADDAAPQDPTFPYGMFSLIDGDGRFQKLTGANKTHEARYQLDFFAKVKSQVKTIATLVSARDEEGGLDGMQASIAQPGQDTVYVQRCKLENFRNGSEVQQSGSEERIFNVGFDAVICFNE